LAELFADLGVGFFARDDEDFLIRLVSKNVKFKSDEAL
jgi:hypothetical protein